MIHGSVECSLLPRVSRFERERSPEAVDAADRVRAMAKVFTHVVAVMTPFYTPDGWDYDWGYYLCPSLACAKHTAWDHGREGSVAVVSPLMLGEWDARDHVHTPEWGVRLSEGDRIAVYVDGDEDTTGRDPWTIMGV